MGRREEQMKYYREEHMAKETFELDSSFLGDHMCPKDHWLSVSMVISYAVETDGFDYDYGEQTGCHQELVGIDAVSPWITAVELFHESNPNTPQEISELYQAEFRSEAERYLKTPDGMERVTNAVNRDFDRGNE